MNRHFYSTSSFGDISDTSCFVYNRVHIFSSSIYFTYVDGFVKSYCESRIISHKSQGLVCAEGCLLRWENERRTTLYIYIVLRRPQYRVLISKGHLEDRDPWFICLLQYLLSPMNLWWDTPSLCPCVAASVANLFYIIFV